MSKPRRPDFLLKARTAEQDGYWNRIGVAWHIDSGGIRIRLNPGVQLSWSDPLALYLFTNEGGPTGDVAGDV